MSDPMTHDLNGMAKTDVLEFLDACVSLIDKRLSNPEWVPRRQHIVADRLAMRSVADAIRRARAQQPGQE